MGRLVPILRRCPARPAADSRCCLLRWHRAPDARSAHVDGEPSVSQHEPASHRERPARSKRPYEEFVADVNATLTHEVRRYAATALPGGLPVGFDVADFVQHALLQLLDLYEPRPNEAAAYAYARATAVNAVRARRRREAPEWLAGVAETHRRPPLTPEESMEHQTRREEVEQALSRLPSRQREAVRLLYMEDFTTKEAARLMGTSQTTVKSLAQRGRDTLRRSLRGNPVRAIPFPRWRRPGWLAAAATPPIAVAIFSLAVIDRPSAMRLPADKGFAVRASDESRHPARPRVHAEARTPRAATAGPAETVSRVRGGHQGGRAEIPDPAATPRAGGCVGSTCVGVSDKGDRLCVEPEPVEFPVCANENLVGLCPFVNDLDLPPLKCDRYSTPTIDPHP